jgi:hypothetical protein
MSAGGCPPAVLEFCFGNDGGFEIFDLLCKKPAEVLAFFDFPIFEYLSKHG